MKYLLTVCCFALLNNLSAQESEHAQEHESLKGTNRLSLGLGHTLISEGKIDGKNQWLAAPSWSLDFDHWFSNRFALGLQTDIITESFIVEDHEQEKVERSYPILLVPVGYYKAGKHLNLFGGVGVEYSSEKTLTLTRLGIEYGFHLPKNWEVGAVLLWDNKWNYYNSWSIVFSVSKLWPKKKKD